MRRFFEDHRRTTKTLQCNSERSWKGIMRSKLSEGTTGKAINKCQKRRTGTIKVHLSAFTGRRIQLNLLASSFLTMKAKPMNKKFCAENPELGKDPAQLEKKPYTIRKNKNRYNARTFGISLQCVSSRSCHTTTFY